MDIILFLKIFLLSLIQGLTEFFPVSSSGHLVLVQNLINFHEIPLIYDIFFHLGTLLAVLIYFFKDLKELIFGFYKSENLRFIFMIVIASIPTAFIGLLFRKPLEAMFSGSESIGYMLLLTSFMLFLSKFVRIPKMNDYFSAFIIGVFQGIAIVPGISRSGFTISIALILSMGYLFSFKFSFILSIPAILGALILELTDIPFHTFHTAYLATGVLFSALFGIAALILLKKIVLKEKFHYFAYYCLIAGIIVILV